MLDQALLEVVSTERGLGAEPPAAGNQLGSGGRISRAWQIFTKNKEFLSIF